MIKINRAKAEDVTRERLRIERTPLLETLDLAFTRALETGQDTSAVVAEKQALRDVTDKDFSALSLAQLAGLSIEDAVAL